MLACPSPVTAGIVSISMQTGVSSQYQILSDLPKTHCSAYASLLRNFHCADADGYFYAPDPQHPGFGEGYIPEREKIMALVRRIDEMYQRVQSQRGRRLKGPTKSAR